MTTLVTVEGALIPAHPQAPRQLTAGGRRSLPTNSQPFTAWESGQVRLVGVGQTVSFTSLYRNQPWVATTVNKLVRQVSRLPLKVYRRDPNGDRALLELAPVPSWHELQFRR